jgi:hypothetical protein
MKYSEILVKGATGGTGSTVADQCFATATAKTRDIPSAQAWFAGGERVGYDPNARAVVRVQSPPLKVFIRQEGDVAHAVSFLPGFPDGSFGWAKVLPHLPNAAEMPNFSSITSAWGTATSPRTTPIPPPAHRSDRSDLARSRCPVDDAGRFRFFLSGHFAALAASN